MTEINKALTKRYLVQRELLPELGPGRTVVTGYMSDDPSVRLRATDRGAWVQIWRPSDSSRYFELPVPIAEAESMMGMCLRRTTRVSWDVLHNRTTWRVSEYTGRHAGLWTAFLELPSRQDGYEEPPWVGRNVSGDRRFTDEGLSRLQRPPI
jgi:adenylate cyclase